MNKQEQEQPKKSKIRKLAEEIQKSGVRCTCDLDNWQPDVIIGHTWVCNIYKIVNERTRMMFNPEEELP
jgi:hypothetical protein